jgi:superfamily II DNA or RNA helicase
MIYSLHKHQEEALKVITECYGNKPVTNVQICTGGGKTVVITEIIKRLNIENVVIVFPTLSLVSQFNKDYIEKGYLENVSFVCSKLDKSINDEFDYLLKTETEIKKIKSGIICTTYSSLSKVLENVKNVDALIFDEAHHSESKNCNEIQEKYKSKIKNTINFSATLKDSQEPDFKYTLSDAIRDNVCKDFTVECFIDLKDKSKNLIERLISIGKITGNNKMMVFTSFSNDTSEDEDDIKELKKRDKSNVEKFIKEYASTAKKQDVWLQGITASTKNRDKILDEFNKSNKLSLLVSCRTLGEGIDISSANAVVFVDPKKSTISIIQVIGRAVRTYKKDGIVLPKEQQRPGSVIVPIYVDSEKYKNALTKEEVDEIMRNAMSKNGDFSTIMNVIVALKQEDEEMYNQCLVYPTQYKKAVEQLEKRDNKKTIVEMPRDGNCFFHCLSEETNLDVPALRNNIVDYIQENREQYTEFETENTDYNKLREDGVFNNDEMDVAVRAASDMLQREIVVHQPDQEPIVYNEGKGDKIEVFRNELHYDLVTDKKKAKKRNENKKKVNIHINPEFKILWKLDDDVDLERDFVARMTYEIERDDLEECWNERFEELKQFIDKNERTPSTSAKNKEEKKLGSWLSNQKTNYKNKTDGMKDKKRYDTWTQFIEEYKDYLLSRDEEWNNTLEELKQFIDKEKRTPLKTIKEENEENKKEKILGKWLSHQIENYKDKKEGMKERYDTWTKFREEYKKYFLSVEEVWDNTLEEVKQFIDKDKNKKKPSRGSKNKEEKTLANWLNTQKQNYKKKIKCMKNKERRDIWDKFTEEYHLVSKDEEWNERLEELKQFIDKNDRTPSSHSSINEEEKKLGSWLFHQKNNYKNKTEGMKDHERYDTWTKFTEDYLDNIKSKSPQSSPPQSSPQQPPQKKYKQGYQSTNPKNKDEINEVIASSLSEEDGVCVVLDHTEFKTTKAILEKNPDARIIIPQNNKDIYKEMKGDSTYGKYVRYEQLEKTIQDLVESEEPVKCIYADLTCDINKAEELMELMFECNFVKGAILGVTISLRNFNPHKPELGEKYTNQDVTGIVSMNWNIFGSLGFKNIIELGACVYGEKCRMATTLFKKY